MERIELVARRWLGAHCQQIEAVAAAMNTTPELVSTDVPIRSALNGIRDKPKIITTGRNGHAPPARLMFTGQLCCI